MRKLMKLDEAAEYLSASVCHVRRLCETGKLPAKNIGAGKSKVWRIHPDDLDAFTMSAQEQTRKKTRTLDCLEIV
jgi:excisionase family DNA binding protein